MATLGDLRTRLKALLDRDDCTDDMATGFLMDGMDLIQSKLRGPLMEKSITTQTMGGPLNTIPIPADLIAPIDLLVPAAAGFCAGDVASDGELALMKKSYRQLQAIPRSYPPTAYSRLQSAFEIRGTVPIGGYVTLVYYGKFSPFASDAAENEISAFSPSLCVYAGLGFAGDFFDSPKLSAWETRFQNFLESAQQQGDDMDNTGGPEVVSPTYES